MVKKTVPNCPKCPKCGNPLVVIVEDIRGVAYTWELSEDGKYHEVDSDHYGETTAYCKNCDADLTPEAWDFWLDRIH